MENKLTFQAGTQEVGGQIRNSSRTRPGQMSSRPITFLLHPPTHACSHSLLPQHTFNSTHKKSNVTTQNHSTLLLISPILSFLWEPKCSWCNRKCTLHQTNAVFLGLDSLKSVFSLSTVLFPSAFYFIKSPSTLLTKAIAFLSLGSDKL